MTPGLLLPTALAALIALAIPLAIHIAKRTESRTIAFAALRWLEPRPRPRRRPRLDERLLLTLRLLLLALLALSLARPVLWDAGDARPVLAVAPGVDLSALPDAAGERRVWLAPGFPPLSEEPVTPTDGLASLIRQLDAELPPDAPLQIAAPATLDGMDAERPRLSRPVEWRVLSGATGADGRAPTAPSLTVRYAAEAEGQVRYFRAAAAAWAPPHAAPDFQAAAIDEPLSDEVRHLVWLAPGPPPEAVLAWVRDGGSALFSSEAEVDLGSDPAPVWRDDVGAPLAVAAPMGRGRAVQLTRPLRPAVMPDLVEGDFPDALEAMLAPPPEPARVAGADHVPLTGAAAYAQPPRDLRPWLALIIALIFAAERWFATHARRGATP